ncbi:MAG: hypothetical protein QOH73_2748 [Gaiellaceae bacterium]|jgi:hypothetical protein|nr:hypothetical protein [Gaiellaceae bacterium]
MSSGATAGTTGGRDRQVVPVLPNVSARGAGNVAPKVANIWRPNPALSREE